MHPHTSAHWLRGYLILLLRSATHATTVSMCFRLSQAVRSVNDTWMFGEPPAWRVQLQCCSDNRWRAIRELQLHSPGAAFQYPREVTTRSTSVLKMMFDVKCWAAPSCLLQRGCACKFPAPNPGEVSHLPAPHFKFQPEASKRSNERCAKHSR